MEKFRHRLKSWNLFPLKFISKQNSNLGYKGFSLIEILITMTIFAVAMLGIASMQTSSVKGNTIAANLTEKTNLVQEQMEQFLSMDYGDIIAGYEEDHENDYNMTWTVVENEPVNNIKRINITIVWNQQNRTVTNQFVTYVRNNTL